MAIQPTCDRCGVELTEPGALFFSPPTAIRSLGDVEEVLVFKKHLCVSCSDKVNDFIAAGVP